MDYFRDQMNPGEMQRGPSLKNMNKEGIGRMVMGSAMQNSGKMRPVMGALTGGEMTFNSSNTETGFAPGESLSVGPNGVRLQGQDAGFTVNPRGGFQVDYSPAGGKATFGVRGQAPINAATPGQAEAYFEIGGPDRDVMATPAELAVDRAIDPSIGIGNNDPGEQIPRTEAQDYLQRQLQNFKPIREGIF